MILNFRAASPIAVTAVALMLGVAGAATSTPATTSRLPAPMQKAMMAHVDAHLAALKRSIGITPDEAASWHQFAEVSRHNATELADLYQARAKSLATMNAVQNMESYARLADRNADDMKTLAVAFGMLYDKLTPAQQDRLNAEFRARSKAMMARHIRHLKHH